MRIITSDLQEHPLAKVFPEMGQAEYERLRNDVAENGQMEPIWLHDGLILDGRHRYQACKELGLAVKAQEYGGDDPVALVKSHNLRRRHLNSSQRALAAARLANWYAEQAKERMRDGGGDHGNQYTGGKKVAGVEKMPPPPSCKKARDQAGEDFGVSGRTVDDAKSIINNGVPKLAELVGSGQMRINTAKKIASLSEKCQHQILSHEDPKMIKAEAKKAVIYSQARRRREKSVRHQESPATQMQHPPVDEDAAIFSHVMYGLERLSEAFQRPGKSDKEIIEASLQKLASADDFTRQRCESLQFAVAILSQLIPALRSVARASTGHDHSTREGVGL